MSRFRVQFTIGRLMVGVAVAAVLCWIATDATVGWVALLVLLPILILTGPLVAVTMFGAFLPRPDHGGDDPAGRPAFPPSDRQDSR